MKILKIVTILSLLLPACGCVPIPSFYPLWDDEHAALEPRLLGDWRGASSDTDIAISVAESKGKTYLMTFTEKKKNTPDIKESRYAAKLVRLGKHLFIDFTGDEASLDKRLEGEIYQALIPAHFFARLNLDGDTMKLAPLDDEKLEERISKKEIRLSFLKNKDNILLTAKTPKIQQALSQLADDNDLWDSATTELHRVPAP